MMTEYQIQPNTRRCAVTGEELRPGERFYTVLLDQGGTFVRQDYSSAAWAGPPARAFSFWAGRVPAAEAPRRPRINDELLLDCFHRLRGETEPGRVNFRYVIALLLMRRKRLKFDRVRQDGGREVLLLRCPRTGAVHEVVNPRLTEEAMVAVQDEVFRVLGWE
jgi:hypothetical protein